MLGADWVNIQGWGEALVNPRLLTPLRKFLFDFRAILADIIRRGQAAGNIDAGITPDAVGQVVLSSFLGLYLQKAVIPDLNISEYKKAVSVLLHGSFTQKS
jgi:hypothetical protein